METTRRGRTLFIADKCYRFPSPVATADAARMVRTTDDPKEADQAVRLHRGRRIQ